MGRGAKPHCKNNAPRFVVFSDDWGRHPSSCQHLFEHIIPRAPVLWVHTIGIRTPRLGGYDLRRAVEVVSGWLRKDEPQREGASVRPQVLRPVMLPSFRSALSSGVNQRLLHRAVRRALDDGSGGRPSILVSTLPIVPGLFASDLFRRKLYYRVDDFSLWPGVSSDAMRRLEAETLERCDGVIAASGELLEDRVRNGARSLLLTHGVDLDHFARAGMPAPETAGLPRPVIGMFGVFDERTDGELLVRLSRRFSSGSIAVVGPIDRDISPFAGLGNVHFLGSVPYADLPARIACFDVCILPYATGPLARSLNPLKLKEYLATGKPVVSTPIPEAVKLQAHLTIAGTEGFCDAVQAALGRDRGVSPALRLLLSEESWEKKAEAFLDFALGGL